MIRIAVAPQATAIRGSSRELKTRYQQAQTRLRASGNSPRASTADVLRDLDETTTVILFQVHEENLPIRKELLGVARLVMTSASAVVGLLIMIVSRR
jgi:hypothetical protein